MISDEVKIPKGIFPVVLKHGEGEGFHFLPCRVKGEKGFYYYVHYASNRMLMIREDGTVPPYEEVKSPLCLATFFLGHCQSLEEMRDLYAIYNPFFTVEKLLRKLDPLLRPVLSQDMRQALDVFIEAVTSVLEHKRRGEEVLSEAEAYAKQFMNEEAVLTRRDFDEMEQFRKPIVYHLHQMDKVQVDSYQDREKLMRYLGSNISFYQIRLWWLYRRLKVYHDRMLEGYTPEKEEDVNELERKLADAKWRAKVEEKDLEEIEKLAVNPK